MLILTRKPDEALVIVADGKVITKVTVIDCRYGRTKLGLEAPENVRIYRTEVWGAICRREGDGKGGVQPDATAGHDSKEGG
jgi:carbon storage regulator CsrA